MKASFYRTKADYIANNYQINLVGHSMGGLVSRYYIENLGYDDHVEKLITIDTPHWGSGYGDAACSSGIAHEICDHDLRFDSAMNGGSFSTNLNCNAIGFNCYNGSYSLTPTLNYAKSRKTKYYAIAGIDYAPDEIRMNDYCFEMPTNYTTYNQMAEFMIGKGLYRNLDGFVPINVKTAGDNMVGLCSQIGWTENISTAPSKRIKMEKIFIDVDTDGGNGGEIIAVEVLKMFHNKIQHRIPVVNQAVHYLQG